MYLQTVLVKTCLGLVMDVTFIFFDKMSHKKVLTENIFNSELQNSDTKEIVAKVGHHLNIFRLMFKQNNLKKF
jgi:hypothetical protein